MFAPTAFSWDDALIEATRRDGDVHLRVYRPTEAAVVLGRGSRADVEVNVDAVKEDGVLLMQRPGGGCSVVLDPGNIIVSVVLPVPGFGGIPRAFEKISLWLAKALDAVGVTGVQQKGISDLAIGDQKIGGACIFRSKGLLYYSTTLLFQPDLNLVDRYLKHPPREPDYRAGRSHSAFMGSIAESAHLTDIDGFAASVETALHKSLTDLASTFASRDTLSTRPTEVFA